MLSETDIIITYKPMMRSNQPSTGPGRSLAMKPGTWRNTTSQPSMAEAEGSVTHGPVVDPARTGRTGPWVRARSRVKH